MEREAAVYRGHSGSWALHCYWRHILVVKVIWAEFFMGRFIGVLSRLGKWFLCPPWLIVTGSSASRMFRLVCVRALIVPVTAGKVAGVWWAEKNNLVLQ